MLCHALLLSRSRPYGLIERLWGENGLCEVVTLRRQVTVLQRQVSAVRALLQRSAAPTELLLCHGH